MNTASSSASPHFGTLTMLVTDAGQGADSAASGSVAMACHGASTLH
ncbi:hypothetical protein [Streptomyces sp. NPDC019890]